MRLSSLLMIQSAWCVLVHSSWPFGTYKAVVRFPLLPTQEIIVTTKEKQRAEITLSGAVNMKESFKYNRSKEAWNVEFGQKFIRILNLCQALRF